ncbi:MAG TPA: hypothetical protein VK914_01340 [bacterium]|jgi:hypothetical protein|nr:hypothetical protein [bacterium]
MAATKKKKTALKVAAPKKKGARALRGASPRKSSKLWVVPVGMLLVLATVGIFLVAHARYLASLQFDMLRDAPIVPQGHDQGQATGLANLAGDPQGHVFVLESQPGTPVRLQRFDAQDSPNTLVYKPAGKGEDLTAAVDVDCDPHGQVYVLLRDGRVQVLSNDLNYERSIFTGITGGSAISVNSAGRIYVADEQNNKVVFFNPTGARGGEFGGPASADVSLVTPILMRVAADDEIVVVEGTPTGMRARIFNKDQTLRKTFLVDKLNEAPPVHMGINSQLKIFFNDASGSSGIDCWDLVTGKFFGASQATKDGVKFVNPGCIGANRYTPDVFVHTVPGLVKCQLPPPGEQSEEAQ